jgi:phosphoglycerate dehydrogenase-like enzyme
MPKVAYFAAYQQNVLDMVAGYAPKGWEVISRNHAATSEEEKIEISKDADFILLHGGKLPEQLFRSAAKVKMLQLLSAGFDNVDMKLMRELELPVANVGGANRQGVAEMAITLMLAVYRRIVALDNGVRAGRWRDLSNGFDTFELNEKTVGIVGFGRIGQTVAKYIQGFDNTILYHDVVSYPEAEKKYRAKRVLLEQLLKQSDIVTVHVPFLKENRGLIGARELAQMKPTAILINTSRGPVIDERALIDVLRAGKIRGAGLDVFEQEPINKDNPLLELQNVVVAPHAAGGTFESWPRRAQFAFYNMQRVWEGKAPESVVTEE